MYKLIPAIILILAVWMIMVQDSEAQKSDWVAPKSADTLENPLDHTRDIINAGNNIFQQLCAVCHGKTGKGDGITAANLVPKPANLGDSTIQNQSEGALFWKIREGRPPMPPFKSQLNDKQVWALVTYIKHLNKNESFK